MTNNIISALTNYGYADIERCNEVLNESSVSDNDLAEYIKDTTLIEDISSVDLVACAYDFILEKVREEIEQVTGSDILNDLKENINVYGNFLATSYDYTDKAKDETLRLALMVENPSRTLSWFIRKIS